MTASVSYNWKASIGMWALATVWVLLALLVPDLRPDNLAVATRCLVATIVMALITGGAGYTKSSTIINTVSMLTYGLAILIALTFMPKTADILSHLFGSPRAPFLGLPVDVSGRLIAALTIPVVASSVVGGIIVGGAYAHASDTRDMVAIGAAGCFVGGLAVGTVAAVLGGSAAELAIAVAVAPFLVALLFGVRQPFVDLYVGVSAGLVMYFAETSQSLESQPPSFRIGMMLAFLAAYVMFWFIMFLLATIRRMQIEDHRSGR